MPNTHSTLTGLFADVADAIRAKTGGSAAIVADDFPDAIAAIPTGGGGGSVPANDVNFYDYDGAIVAAYSASEFAQLSALPANPSHDGLSAQGWNWSLSDAKTYVASYGKLNIGQMYTTSDGKTRIYIRLEDGRLAPYLGIAINGTATVDWGDGTSSTVTGSSTSTVVNTQHTYSAAGDYVIAIAVTGSMTLVGSAGYGSYVLWKTNATNGALNQAYQNAIQKVEIGSNTIIGNHAFSTCKALASVIIPSTVTSIGDSAFSGCYGLGSATIPSGVTSIGNCAFQNCYTLASVTISSTVTNIVRFAFYGCYALPSVIIPSTVTSIGDSAFKSCYGLGFIKFTRTTPPTVSSSDAWSNIPADCVIYVPSASLNAYKSASNYPSALTYTYVGY